MSRPWRFTPLDPTRVRRLSEALEVGPLTAQVLIARGLDEPAAAKAFLNPTPNDLHAPETLPGVPEAADRIVAAVRADRRVTVFGDYDVDGITSTALLVDCLRLAGAPADYVIPNRNDGYGLNVAAIERLHAEDPRRLVVTVDCGITSIAEAKRAGELGLELIVTDHHTPGDALPDAAVVVHPRRPDAETPYAFGELCGAGVAFKLAWAVAKRLGDGDRVNERFKHWLIRALGLTALATVADMVPLTGENRTFVHCGLRSLYHHAPPGLRALLTVSGIEEGRPITAEDVGFKLGPRINAAGRLDQASLAVDLLLSDDPKRTAQLADYLNTLNETRKKTEAEVVKAAKKQAVDEGWAERPGLALASADWHAGVVGIAAGRIAEKFDTPSVVIAFGHGGDPDLGAGSARSRPGFDLHACLGRCAEHLETYGGHTMAAGLKVRRENLEAFREAFAADVAERFSPEAADARVDAEVRLADCTLHAVKELDETLGPFGKSNRRPVFVATGVTLEGEPRTMGRDGSHLSARLTQTGRTMKAVAWGRAADAATLAAGPLAISFTTEVNRWKNGESVQLQLREWKPG